MLERFLFVAGAYLFGSISSAILITRLWTGKDIRTLGNRNAGAANVARSVGIWPAVCVGLVDFSKGALPVLVARALGLGKTWALVGAAVAVIGHSYPVYFRFRGGKGLATSLGALLALTPLETLLILPVLGVVYLILTGSAVSGALVGLLLLVGLNWWRGYSPVVVLSPLILLLVMGLCTIPQVLYDWARRPNAGKLLCYWLSPKETSLRPRPVAIVTDSIASLPEEICVREGIAVVPLSLILPQGVYRDGIDIDARVYYQMLRAERFSPRTSAPSPGEYLSLYQRLASDYEAAIVVTPPAALTQTWESARLAGEMIRETFTVHVIDSHVAGPAQGFVALALARLARQGLPLAAILQAAEVVRQQVGFVGVLNTLKFLAEGGRVAEAQQWVKSALHVYPVLSIAQGRVRVLGMARTKVKAVRRMVQWLQNTLHGRELALAFCHTDAAAEAESLAQELTACFHPNQWFITELTPVIGAHAGPGLLGVAWWIQGGDEGWSPC
jgi:acyl-phosphate glycerol 3-phosphate acyltransferase